MDLVYADESGDRGYNGSKTYTLAGVMVNDAAWIDTFDGLLDFRRWAKRSFGLKVRAEVKASWLVRNAGSIEPLGLGETARHDLYRQFMRLAPKLDMRVFAVVIVKDRIYKRDKDPRDIAWEYFIQRLERHSEDSQSQVLLVHDEGEAERVRKLFRKARRANTPGGAFGTGHLHLPARRILDDPVPRNSNQSYFVQLADLCAYAAFRTVIPPPPKVNSVCPQSMWNELGKACHAGVRAAAAGGLPA